MAKTVEFIKVHGLYHVEVRGLYAGKVRKFEDWTTRGSSVRWQAETKNGRVIGSGKTRGEAASLLPLVRAEKMV